jgi:hypothetical protein
LAGPWSSGLFRALSPLQRAFVSCTIETTQFGAGDIIVQEGDWGDGRGLPTAFPGSLRGLT